MAQTQKKGINACCGNGEIFIGIAALHINIEIEPVIGAILRRTAESAPELDEVRIALIGNQTRELEIGCGFEFQAVSISKSQAGSGRRSSFSRLASRTKSEPAVISSQPGLRLKFHWPAFSRYHCQSSSCAPLKSSLKMRGSAVGASAGSLCPAGAGFSTCIC
jgi:hypothetical protein